VPLDRVRLTAAKSSLGRHRNRSSASPDPRARAQPRRWTTDSASPDPRARTQPRPRKTVSASRDPRARAQPRRWTTDSASPDLGLELSLGLGRWSPPRPTQGSDSTSTSEDGLRLTRPQGSDSASTSEDGFDLDLGGAFASPDLGLGPTKSQGGGIITLPLASSGYGEQDRRPIWLAPVHK
jgi:hypothetical protein